MGVKVFSLDGRCVFAGNVSGTKMIPAEPGVYVVAVGETTFKVVVR